MKNSDYILYLDMDGVLVDFEGGYKRIARGKDFDQIAAQSDERTAQEVYHARGVKFWSELDWIHGGKELYQAAKSLYEHVAILSSSGTRDELKGQTVKAGKMLWLNNNIPDMNVENVFIVNGKEFKQQYADRMSILVDDVPVTIRQWTSQGGYGILHNASHYKKTIEELEDIARPIKLSELVRRSFWKR